MTENAEPKRQLSGPYVSPSDLTQRASTEARRSGFVRLFEGEQGLAVSRDTAPSANPTAIPLPEGRHDLRRKPGGL
jgi:hypothetical protein